MKRWKQVCSTMLAGTMLFQTPVAAAPKEEERRKISLGIRLETGRRYNHRGCLPDLSCSPED